MFLRKDNRFYSSFVVVGRITGEGELVWVASAFDDTGLLLRKPDGEPFHGEASSPEIAVRRVRFSMIDYKPRPSRV